MSWPATYPRATVNIGPYPHRETALDGVKVTFLPKAHQLTHESVTFKPQPVIGRALAGTETSVEVPLGEYLVKVERPTGADVHPPFDMSITSTSTVYDVDAAYAAKVAAGAKYLVTPDPENPGLYLFVEYSTPL